MTNERDVMLWRIEQDAKILKTMGNNISRGSNPIILDNETGAKISWQSYLKGGMKRVNQIQTQARFFFELNRSNTGPWVSHRPIVVYRIADLLFQMEIYLRAAKDKNINNNNERQKILARVEKMQKEREKLSGLLKQNKEDEAYNLVKDTCIRDSSAGLPQEPKGMQKVFENAISQVDQNASRANEAIEKAYNQAIRVNQLGDRFLKLTKVVVSMQQGAKWTKLKKLKSLEGYLSNMHEDVIGIRNAFFERKITPQHEEKLKNLEKVAKEFNDLEGLERGGASALVVQMKNLESRVSKLYEEAKGIAQQKQAVQKSAASLQSAIPQMQKQAVQKSAASLQSAIPQMQKQAVKNDLQPSTASQQQQGQAQAIEYTISQSLGDKFKDFDPIQNLVQQAEVQQAEAQQKQAVQKSAASLQSAIPVMPKQDPLKLDKEFFEREKALEIMSENIQKLVIEAQLKNQMDKMEMLDRWAGAISNELAENNRKYMDVGNIREDQMQAVIEFQNGLNEVSPQVKKELQQLKDQLKANEQMSGTDGVEVQLEAMVQETKQIQQQVKDLLDAYLKGGSQQSLDENWLTSQLQQQVNDYIKVKSQNLQQSSQAIKHTIRQSLGDKFKDSDPMQNLVQQAEVQQAEAQQAEAQQALDEFSSYLEFVTAKVAALKQQPETEMRKWMREKLVEAVPEISKAIDSAKGLRESAAKGILTEKQKERLGVLNKFGGELKGYFSSIIAEAQQAEAQQEQEVQKPAADSQSATLQMSRQTAKTDSQPATLQMSRQTAKTDSQPATLQMSRQTAKTDSQPAMLQMSKQTEKTDSQPATLQMSRQTAKTDLQPSTASQQQPGQAQDIEHTIRQSLGETFKVFDPIQNKAQQAAVQKSATDLKPVTPVMSQSVTRSGSQQQMRYRQENEMETTIVTVEQINDTMISLPKTVEADDSRSIIPVQSDSGSSTPAQSDSEDLGEEMIQLPVR